MLGRGRARRSSSREGRLMAILVDADDAPRRPGHHRPRGQLPRAPQPRLRHRRRRRRHARQGRARRSTASRCSTPSPTPSPRRARTRRWCSSRRGSPPTRSTRPSTRASRRSSASPRASRRTTCCGVYGYVRARGVTLLGPELPGRALARPRERRHHPGAGVRRGPHRPRVPLAARSPTRSARSSPSAGSATRRSSASAATRSSASASSTSLERFEADPDTDLVVMVGEIGGDEEEKAAAFIGDAHARSRWSPTSPGSRRRPARRWATPARSSPARRAPPQAKKDALEAHGVRGRTEPDRGRAARRRTLAAARLTGGRMPPLPVGWIHAAALDPLHPRRPLRRPAPGRRHARGRGDARCDDDPTGALSYAPGGYAPLREWIGARHGVDAGRVLMHERLAAGARLPRPALLRRGRRSAVVEAPTYDRTLMILRRAGADIRAVPLDADGIDVDAPGRAARARDCGRGSSTSSRPTRTPPARAPRLERRQALLELAREYDLLLVEDDPYGLLRFEGDAAADAARARRWRRRDLLARRSRRRSRRACAPATLVLPERAARQPLALIRRTPTSARTRWPRRSSRRTATPAGSSPTSRVRRRACAPGATRWSRRSREHFPAGSRWTTPRGGYFFWVDLPDGIDTSEALATAVEQGVPYVTRCRLLRRGRRSQLAAAGLQRVRDRPDRRGHRPPRRGARVAAHRCRRLSPAARRS